MLQIIVTVTPERDRAAHLRIVDGLRTLSDDWAVASADRKAAARVGNAQADPLRPGGHPPLGRYELTAQGIPPNGTEPEYGRALLLFEPVGGQALDAESYGRLALLVYAGRMAPDTRLRRTQGGLRLTSMAMDLLLTRLDDSTPVELRIEVVQAPPWWAFWRKPREHPPLSNRPPQFDTPPLDEATLLTELMKSARRRGPRASPTRDDDDFERRRDRSRESSSSSSDAPEFRGRGGEGGGAGASGTWSDAPAAGRGPGVDTAGRIATAAGVAGVAAVAAATAMAARDHATAESQSTHRNASEGDTSASNASADANETTGANDTASFSTTSSDSSDDTGWTASGTSY